MKDFFGDLLMLPPVVSASIKEKLIHAFLIDFAHNGSFSISCAYLFAVTGETRVKRSVVDTDESAFHFWCEKSRVRDVEKMVRNKPDRLLRRHPVL